MTVLGFTDDGVVLVDVVFHGGSQDPIDELPVVDVLRPARGEVVTGPLTYEVRVFDPDVGGWNGAGIDHVDFAIVFGDSDANILVSGSDSTPPYTLDFDPAAVPDFVDNAYSLAITAVSVNGGTNQYAFAHLIDLTGPHPSIPPPAGEAGRPPAVLGVLLSGAQATQLDWQPASFADEYDVSRGLLVELDGLDYGVCRNAHDPDLTDTSFIETQIPSTGEGFYYLVRGRNLTCPASGSYGNLSQGGQRINHNPAACP